MIFRVGPVYCCVPASCVDSIVCAQVLRALPNQADHILGIIHYRKHTTTIVNLFHRFNFPVPSFIENSFFIVSSSVCHVGFWVDEVIEISNQTEENNTLPPVFTKKNIFTETRLWREKIILKTDFDLLLQMQESKPLQRWLDKDKGNALAKSNPESIMEVSDWVSWCLPRDELSDHKIEKLLESGYKHSQIEEYQDSAIAQYSRQVTDRESQQSNDLYVDSKKPIITDEEEGVSTFILTTYVDGDSVNGDSANIDEDIDRDAVLEEQVNNVSQSIFLFDDEETDLQQKSDKKLPDDKPEKLVLLAYSDSDFVSYLLELEEQIESVIESNSAQVDFSFEPSEQIDFIEDQKIDEVDDSEVENPNAVMSHLFRHPDFIQSDFSDVNFAENQAIVVKHDKAVSLIIARIEKNRCSNSKTSPARYTICILIVAIGLFLVQHYWINNDNVSPPNISSIQLLVEKSLSGHGSNNSNAAIETVVDKYGIEYSVNYAKKKIIPSTAIGDVEK